MSSRKRKGGRVDIPPLETKANDVDFGLDDDLGWLEFYRENSLSKLPNLEYAKPDNANDVSEAADLDDFDGNCEMLDYGCDSTDLKEATERASELPEWARNLISNLANERDFWKKQSTEYESSVIVEKHVNDFVPGGRVVSNQLKDKIFPADTKLNTKQRFISIVATFTPEQKYMFQYLYGKLQLVKDSIPQNYVMYNLPEMEWLRVLAQIAHRIKEITVDGCCGDQTTARGLDSRRPAVVFLDRYNTRRYTTSARVIVGILYGFDCLVGRHASHLCGNGFCLTPSHLWPENAARNLSRDPCHESGFVEASTCKHFPTCLKSMKFDPNVRKTFRKFEHVKIVLTSENFVENVKGTTNIRFNDHEYRREGMPGTYTCVNRNNYTCRAYITVKSDKFGTTSAIEAVGHSATCVTVGEKHDKWMAESSELTEDMKILKDGVVKNLQIGVHKYYFSKVWTCTKHIGKVACGASLKIRGTRYLLKRPHRCNTSKKEKDTKTELESQARRYKTFYKKDENGQSTDSVSHYLIGGVRYSKNMKCTKTDNSRKPNRACPSKLVLFDNGLAATTEHICNKYRNSDIVYEVSTDDEDKSDKECDSNENDQL